MALIKYSIIEFYVLTLFKHPSTSKYDANYICSKWTAFYYIIDKFCATDTADVTKNNETSSLSMATRS